jgi:hypothetical protein
MTHARLTSILLSTTLIAGLGACDSETPDEQPDAGFPIIDQGSDPDLGTPPEDMGTPPEDMGQPEDMGTDMGEDTTPPTVSISDNVPDAVAMGDVTFTFTFSEDVVGFDEGDLSVSEGTAGGFTIVSTTEASVVVSPPADATGTITVTVGAMSFEDEAGNQNEEAATASQDYDTVIPAGGTTLVDFEAMPPAGLRGFGGAEDATVAPDPMMAGNNVARLVRSDTAAVFAGATVFYCPMEGIAELPFSGTASTISLRVLSPVANVPVRVKVENTANGALSVESEAMVTAANTWQMITVDFTNEVAGTPALDLGVTYDKLSVFPNFGVEGAAVGEQIFFVDDIRFEDVSFPNTCPMVGLQPGLPYTFDNPMVNYQLAGFEGAEDSTIVVDPISGTGNVGRALKSNTAATFAGTTFSTGPNESVALLPVGATNSELQLRVLSPRANIPVRLKIEEALDPTRSVETEATVTVADQWQTIVFDFANEAPGTAALNPTYNYNQVTVFFDFGTDGASGGGGEFFWDDLDTVP